MRPRRTSIAAVAIKAAATAAFAIADLLLLRIFWTDAVQRFSFDWWIWAGASVAGVIAGVIAVGTFRLEGRLARACALLIAIFVSALLLHVPVLWVTRGREISLPALLQSDWATDGTRGQIAAAVIAGAAWRATLSDKGRKKGHEPSANSVPGETTEDV